MSGTLNAASRGVQSLSDYINGRDCGNQKQKQKVLKNALSHAARNAPKSPRAFNTLLDFGVDPNCPELTKDGSDKNPLLSTIESGEFELVAFLLSEGADVNTPNALNLAAENNSLQIV